jgi:hypothetical protein
VIASGFPIPIGRAFIGTGTHPGKVSYNGHLLYIAYGVSEYTFDKYEILVENTPCVCKACEPCAACETCAACKPCVACACAPCQCKSCKKSFKKSHKKPCRHHKRTSSESDERTDE